MRKFVGSGVVGSEIAKAMASVESGEWISPLVVLQASLLFVEIRRMLIM